MDLRLKLTFLAVLAVGVIGASAELYFPKKGEWERVSPESIGLDPDKLQKALDYAGRNQSSGVVILHQGRILAEQYWEVEGKRSAKFGSRVIGRTDAGHPIEDVASVQKSVVSVLVGIAREKGLLKLSDPVSEHLGPGWSKAGLRQEKEITIRHLITMTSGLKENARFEARAGTKWRYNTWAYAQTVAVLEKASGRARHELTHEWLTNPLGMNDSKWTPRRAAEIPSVNAFGFATSARDLARFGLMMLANGKWAGKTILDENYLRDSTQTSQRMNPHYGYLWWLNRDANKPRSRRNASSPPDTFSANGALNRRCWVSPEIQLVITRIGDQPPAKRGFDEEFWRLLRASKK